MSDPRDQATKAVLGYLQISFDHVPGATPTRGDARQIVALVESFLIPQIGDQTLGQIVEYFDEETPEHEHYYELTDSRCQICGKDAHGRG